MPDPTVRVTRHLSDGQEIEAEAEQRGSLIRLRARISRGGFGGLVTAAFRVTAPITYLMTHREFLPKEFSCDPAIARATLEPVEEIWRARLRFFR